MHQALIGSIAQAIGHLSSAIRDSNTTFKWCSNGAKVQQAIYKPGQPNNVTEKCGHIMISKKNSTALMEDKNCSLLKFYACQVQILCWYFFPDDLLN
jgi:hypothetical protein